MLLNIQTISNDCKKIRLLMMNKLTPKKFALTFILFLLTASVFAQKTVTGKVTDSGKRPAVGATISVKGTTTAINFTSVPAEEFGGATGTATFATDVMTVGSTTAGSFYAGQLILSSGVTAGTYIVAQLSPTTFQLSTTPGTITPAQAVTASAWIETAFSVESLAGEGELVKVGRSL